MKTEKEHYYESVPTDIKDEKKNPIPTSLPGFGVRHFQTIIMFVSITIAMVARTHPGATIVGMTTTQHQNQTRNETLFNNGSIEVDNEEKAYEVFDWSKSIQEMILNAFFIGYCSMMLPIAMVIQKYGGKLPLQISLLINGVTSLLTPCLTSWGGWKALCVCRIIQGLSQAGTYPSIQNLLAQWVPISERGRMSSYVYAGPTLGTVIAFQLAGALSQTRLGWPLTFYVVGVLCVVCFIFITMFAAASPLLHKSITEEEKNFIRGHSDNTIVKKKSKIPWKAVITSKAVWGALFAQIGSGLTFVFLVNQVPSYIHYICGSDIRNSGFLSSLPFIASLFTTPLFGILSDFLTNRKIVSIANARRISNSVSHFGAGFGLLATSFTTSTIGAITCLVLSTSLFTALNTGWLVNHNDIAPNYSASLIAIGNIMYNIFVLILPVVISFVITDMNNLYQWRTMISIVTGISFITGIAFVTLMSADVQPWNDEVDADSDDYKGEKKDSKKEASEMKTTKQ